MGAGGLFDRLALYVERAQELEDCRLVRRGFNPGLTIKWDRMSGLRFESREPDEEDLRSFLITFRQFISDDEPVYLNRIYNLCQQFLTGDDLKGYLVQARAAWKETQKRSGLRVVLNGRELTPEFVTDLWINGYYFHNDGEKRAVLKRLVPHERMLVRYCFLDFLVEATRQVLYVANVVRVALRKGLLADGA